MTPACKTLLNLINLEKTWCSRCYFLIKCFKWPFLETFSPLGLSFTSASDLAYYAFHNAFNYSNCIKGLELELELFMTPPQHATCDDTNGKLKLVLLIEWTGQASGSALNKNLTVLWLRVNSTHNCAAVKKQNKKNHLVLMPHLFMNDQRSEVLECFLWFIHHPVSTFCSGTKGSIISPM